MMNKSKEELLKIIKLALKLIDDAVGSDYKILNLVENTLKEIYKK